MEEGENKASLAGENEEESVQNENSVQLTRLHLEIPLLQAERAWSYAMQLKQDYEHDQVENGRRNRHMIQRLSKAVKWSEQLNKLCDKVGDSRTALQAQTYGLLMQGNYHLERDDLEKAVVVLSKAKNLLEQLISVAYVH